MELSLRVRVILYCRKKKADYSAETPPNLIDESVGVTTTENAESIRKTYSGRKVFDFPKPSGLIEYLAAFKENSIILDCFGGSGTTAEAVCALMPRRWKSPLHACGAGRLCGNNHGRKGETGHKGLFDKEETQTLLYSRKLTLRNLHRAQEFIDEAKKLPKERVKTTIMSRDGIYGVYH